MLMYKYPCGCIGLGCPPTASVDPDGSTSYKDVPTLVHCDNEGASRDGIHLTGRTLRGPEGRESGPTLVTDPKIHGIAQLHFRDLYRDQGDLADIRKGFAALAYPKS